jgi:hypothetical protein
MSLSDDLKWCFARHDDQSRRLFPRDTKGTPIDPGVFVTRWLAFMVTLFVIGSLS